MADNGYGGILPTSQWAKADAAISSAWDIHSKLKDSAGGSSKDYILSSINQFGKEITSLSARLEQLKHGPTPTSGVGAIDDWQRRVNDLPRWAGEIDKTANFTSTWGAIKFVSIESAKDAGGIAIDAAKSAAVIGDIGIFLIKNGPVLIIAGVAIYFGVMYGLPMLRKMRGG